MIQTVAGTGEWSSESMMAGVVFILTGELNCSVVTPCELHRGESRMDALIEKLDTRLRQRKPETASQVRQFVAEIRNGSDGNSHSSYEVPLPRLSFLDRDSVANVQGLGSLPLVRLERRLGHTAA
jgi:hypothetical protein